MARSKSTSARRHRKVLKEAKGFKNASRKRIKAAKEATLHAGQYAYIGRKLRRRDLRKLWTLRISAATKAQNISYSKFINLLKKENIELDRKILADLVLSDPNTFQKVIDKVKPTK
jgi:large subunit ribosomal protein L20